MRSKIQYLPTTVFMAMAAFVWVFMASDAIAWYPATYADSAHGDNSEGVNRSGIDYPTGDCAHCHDALDPSSCGDYPFMLFYDDVISIADMLCFTCHSGNATWQPTTNNPYVVNFGGYPTPYYTDIYTQFNDAGSTPAACGSRHNLVQIYLALKSSVGQAWGFNTDPNPCVACHPPHAAQRNHPVADVSGGGKLNTAIRRPSHYKSTELTASLWGDDSNERMSSYASQFTDGVYQAPYYGNGPWDPEDGPFEPAGDGTSDGSNLPDYVTFCMDCHQYPLNDPDRGNILVRAIEWDGSNADIHGAAHANTCTSGSPWEGTLRAPYVNSPNSNYVLSCLDCHEPHGTYKRCELLRRWINGELVSEVSDACNGDQDWLGICERCHNLPHPGGSCNTCHMTKPGSSDQMGCFHGGKIMNAIVPCGGEPGF